MNPDPLLSGGSLALVSYLVVWFTRTAFPAALTALSEMLAKYGADSLAKIEAIERQCLAERRELVSAFRAECEEQRRLYREDLAAERAARAAARGESTARPRAAE